MDGGQSPEPDQCAERVGGQVDCVRMCVGDARARDEIDDSVLLAYSLWGRSSSPVPTACTDCSSCMTGLVEQALVTS